MSKAVMISIQPKWCELIASGRKIIELRKRRPSIETPFKCYIYQTKKKWIYRLLKKLGLYKGKVIGEFVCDYIKTFEPFIDIDGRSEYYFVYHQETCLNYKEFREYGNGKPLYGLHISDLVIYDKPKELGEFRTGRKKAVDCGYGNYNIYEEILERPFQSWGYVEEVENGASKNE